MTKTIADWTKRIRSLIDVKFPDFNPTIEDLPKLLMYITSEASECLEAWRDDDQEAIAEEFADMAIRLLDYADRMGVDLDYEMEKKMAKNWTRPTNHGRKRV